ncbi:DUF1330 domain-containing protein [Aliiroseovarius sp. PTFE2010]|uniref:DUF1330 domain-containing protein n=1 Tax=Aliiroseovarius sp. PTFE2010 TaxID=3417190 RepID=UPI003CEB9752
MTEHYVGFDKATFEAFKGVDRTGPIHMLNLIKLKDQATYDDGRSATGAEAYAAYSRETGSILERVGGRIVWRGAMEIMLIGPKDEHWDLCFIAEYPSVQAFIDMIYDPEYRRAMIHRQAGVLTSRLVRTEPLGGGDTFG